MAQGATPTPVKPNWMAAMESWKSAVLVAKNVGALMASALVSALAITSLMSPLPSFCRDFACAAAHAACQQLAVHDRCAVQHVLLSQSVTCLPGAHAHIRAVPSSCGNKEHLINMQPQIECTSELQATVIGACCPWKKRAAHRLAHLCHDALLEGLHRLQALRLVPASKGQRLCHHSCPLLCALCRNWQIYVAGHR